MSDNPQYGAATAFALPGIRVVRLTGRDAVPFAQSQFMNDVAALGDGTWQWNGWLDPKGRVQALFALLRLDAGTLLLATTADADGLSAALRRFVFRSRLAIDAPGLVATGRFAAPAGASGAMAAIGADGGVELDLSADGGPRTLRLAPAADDPAGDGESRWWAFDIAHGWPAPAGVDLAAWTPQQLSLQRLSAFSVKKGCYPGQEIVARTHFLGRAKRALARFRPGVLPGAAILDATGREVGQVVCAVRGEVLAVVPTDAGTGGFRCGDTALESLPLLGGLQR